ncbi:MAG: TonB-dependent receptor [Ferruginibacter sp.]|nr:TonB-dependent receptor [Ferruginibacter sp.]
MKHLLKLFICTFCSGNAFSQPSVSGNITSADKPLSFATVLINPGAAAVIADSAGYFHQPLPVGGKYILTISRAGYSTINLKVFVADHVDTTLEVELTALPGAMEELVITGTMKEVSRTESAVPVEVITAKLFQKNPTPSLFEAVGMVNGVQPQLNCNVCNTGDIHINGMEGPYTMILIDGMPIVSALATVYGLSGIPNSLVERIEVVKGPGSSLYGSEAMGGIINVITKNPLRAPNISADVFVTGWGELSVDAALKTSVGNATSLLGINYFNYQQPIDNNKDGFTDVTQQHRISIFNKWNFQRSKNRVASLAGRYVYEDRWGGQTTWDKHWRGSDSIYGESIYTNRAELIGIYQLPVAEKIITQFSFNDHRQNSWYGTTSYNARQQVAFVQMYWDKLLKAGHNFLLGSSVRYTAYDDNTPATSSADQKANQPSNIFLPGIFAQDEWTISQRHKLLLGYRYDLEKHHGAVHSPRIAYKFSPVKNQTLRASFGTGFRVVNLFTEDHAALTGAREVVIEETLKPERSYNGNLNYVLKIPGPKSQLNFDLTAFYSYFSNKITGDFDSDPNKIIYRNLRGHAVSRGLSLNTDMNFNFPLKVLAGITWMDVRMLEEKAGQIFRTKQLHAPDWSGTFVCTYTASKKLAFDLSGKWDGPMRLPVLPNDYRPEYSPWFCIANIQVTKKFKGGWELYCGIKNLLNFVPADPIMRAFDPFDKTANDPVTNPAGYTFDPGYNFASLQGIRGFVGLRYQFFAK